MPEMDVPRALVFRPLVKGKEAQGTRLCDRLKGSTQSSRHSAHARSKSDKMKSDWLFIRNEFSAHAQKIELSQRTRILVLTKMSAASYLRSQDETFYCRVPSTADTGCGVIGFARSTTVQ